ncbi:MAG TPA: hypothetical protein VLA33_05590 [Gemmatimonadota bacterium]|nr:hypothetical protein [Gemmatimonadota bacterium]
MRRVNWEALGTVAELVGAAGVIVSIVYVAMEIQQNTRQVEEASRAEQLMQLDAAFENFSRQRLLVAQDPDVARIWLTGAEDPSSLSPVERFRFEAMVGDFLHASQVLYSRTDEGALYPEVWDNLLVSLLPVLQRPGVAAYWEEWRPEFRSDFVAAVDSLIVRAPVPAVEERDSAA